MSTVTAFPSAMQHQTPMTPAIHRQLDRAAVAQTIAQMLLALHCREEGERPIRLRDMAPKDAQPFWKAGEMVVQLMLRPNLERTAQMAVADLICQDHFGDDADLKILHVCHETAGRFYRLAGAVIRAYKATLVFQSGDPEGDWHYDNLLDVLIEDGKVQS